MEPPVRKVGFVKTKVYKATSESMDDSSVTLISLIGPAGSGKSTLATELCCDKWPYDLPPDEVNFMYRLFNCAKLEDFYSDLILFYQSIDKTQVKLGPRFTPTWSILQTFFNDMNRFYPNHVKLFILDDVEPIEDILQALNHICQIIRMMPGLDTQWKILLTSQRKPLNPDVYADIGGDNFFDVDGFDAEEVKHLVRDSELTLTETDVREIINTLGNRPLILQICIGTLKSNQVEDVSECVQNLLQDIEVEVSALDRSDREESLTSALVGVKISIERLLEELPHSQACLDVCKLLTLLNERNITKELLVACAETFTKDPKTAASLFRSLTSSLINRGVCTKRVEGKVPLFRLHQLVKQSMMLFVREEEKIRLIQHALVALTLVMPKDGRNHQTRLVGFYGKHGKTLDGVIRNTQGQTPFILLLQSSMLTSMGYCHLAQRTGDYKEAVRLLKSALNKYCELVLNCDYESLLPPLLTRLEDKIAAAEVAAEKLFLASKAVDWSQSQVYQEYIKQLPAYYRLTKKDLGNMGYDPTTRGLVNDHLTFDLLNDLRMAKKVLPEDVLMKVYIAEVLAQIYSVWSTIHKKREDYRGAVEECLVNAAAANKVYTLIFKEYKVYLLAGLITEREHLSIKLPQVSTAEDVRQIKDKFAELCEVGSLHDKCHAYEAGLVRSDLSRDRYHRLLCKEGEISCHGYLYQLTSDPDCYAQGEQLFEEVKHLAKEQVYSHSTLSYSYKNFSKFLVCCKDFGQAVISILLAMSELRESLSRDFPRQHPEFTHPRFRSLNTSLESYYGRFTNARADAMRARDEISVREKEKLIKLNTPEHIYLCSAIRAWKDICFNGGGAIFSEGEPVPQSSNQPAEDNSALRCMEIIHDKEIPEALLPVSVVNG